MSLAEHREEVQKKIGYLPENCRLYSEMTVIDALEYAAELQGVPQGQRLDAIRQEVEAICDRVISILNGRLALDSRLEDLWSSRRLLLCIDRAPAASRELAALEGVGTLLSFLIAAVTMWIWSEERCMGTLKLLLTPPVNPFRLVFGRFMTCMARVGIALLPTLPVPIWMRRVMSHPVLWLHARLVGVEIDGGSLGLPSGVKEPHVRWRTRRSSSSADRESRCGAGGPVRVRSR